MNGRARRNLDSASPKGHLREPDGRGYIKVGVKAPVFRATAVIPVAGHPNASRISDNAYPPIRVIGKIEPDKRVTEENDVDRAIDLVDDAHQCCHSQAEMLGDIPQDFREKLSP